MKRPPQMTSRVAICSATSTGWCRGRSRTPVPSDIRPDSGATLARTGVGGREGEGGAGGRDAAWNGRTRADGGEHGAAAHQGRSPVRGLRPLAEGGAGDGEGEGGRD